MTDDKPKHALIQRPPRNARELAQLHPETTDLERDAARVIAEGIKPMPEAAPALKPGSSTSEFKLTLASMLGGAVLVIGTVADSAGLLGHAANSLGLAGNPVLQAVIVISGVILVAAAKLGYTRSRTLQKIAAMENGVVEAGKVIVPVVKELRAGTQPTLTGENQKQP